MELESNLSTMDTVDPVDLNDTAVDYQENEVNEEEAAFRHSENEKEGLRQKLQPSAQDIYLNVKCEIGTVSYSLADITKYQVGDIIEFTRWPNKVKLTINGVSFAEGILVEVEGMLGVKIINKL